MASAAHVAETLTQGLNLLAGFAAPHLITRMWSGNGLALKEHAREHLARFVDILPDLQRADPPAPPELAAKLEQFGYALDAWNGAGGPPHDVVAAARACLASIGLPEPPETWDKWEPKE
jgi:hypothetical protein